jgi:hypothetical protein
LLLATLLAALIVLAALAALLTTLATLLPLLAALLTSLALLASLLLRVILLTLFWILSHVYVSFQLGILRASWHRGLLRHASHH